MFWTIKEYCMSFSNIFFQTDVTFYKLSLISFSQSRTSQLLFSLYSRLKSLHYFKLILIKNYGLF